MPVSDLRQKLQDALANAGGASSDFDLNPDVKAPVGKLTPAAVLILSLIHISEPTRLWSGSRLACSC